MKDDITILRNCSEIPKEALQKYSRGSVFSNFLQLFLQEALYGGEIQMAMHDGTVDGLFVYDPIENAGTCFSHNRDVILKFLKSYRNMEFYTQYNLKRKCLIERVFQLKITYGITIPCLKNRIEIFRGELTSELVSFMTNAYGKINKSWVRSALDAGEKCFLCRKEGSICGMGWIGRSGNSGRLHSLYVLDYYRNEGIGTDLMNARVMWAKMVGIETIISEVPDESKFSRKIEEKMGFSQVEILYHYRS